MLAEERLRRVPWAALAGLGPLLAPALNDVLSGQAAERVLDKLLRAHREFASEQRAVVAESLFGVGLWRRRLRWHHDGTPLELLAVLARELGGFAGAEAALGVQLPLLRELSDDWRVRWSFPDWIADHLETRFGSQAALVAEAINRPGPVCLRSRGPREALRQRLAEKGVEAQPTRFASQGLVVITPRPNLLGLGPEFLGTFEVQDEGSQLLGEMLGVQPGEHVLDLCAGAGGKALQFAALVRPLPRGGEGAPDEGRVHATDADLSRLERLRTRAAKANARVLIHGREPPENLIVQRVLIDAPCSELGALRRGPDLRWRLDPSAIPELAKLQRDLVEKGLRHLAPDGRLVYATCTLTRAENEAVVDGVLAAHPELHLVKPALAPDLLDARGCLVIDPHHHGTDGFFGAAFERR